MGPKRALKGMGPKRTLKGMGPKKTREGMGPKSGLKGWGPKGPLKGWGPKGLPSPMLMLGPLASDEIFRPPAAEVEIYVIHGLAAPPTLFCH